MANPLVSMGAPLTNPVSPVNIQNTEEFKQTMQSAKRMIGMLQAVKNPQKAIMQAAQQNPQLNATLQMLNGRSFQDACMEEYKKYGIDPTSIVEELRR